jgi:hypothetical protein
MKSLAVTEVSSILGEAHRNSRVYAMHPEESECGTLDRVRHGL